MAKPKSQNLFRRLTRLFRSGPIVQRKLRSVDTTIAVADKGKSSGTLLFQKSLAPTYATITANAYNLSERLMRYQDFQEMEYCVHGGQLIASPEAPDGFIKIKDLATQCADDPNKTFIVYSYDHEKKQIVPTFGKQARQTRVDHAWKVTFDNGKEVVASANHRLMLRDGTYRKIEDLQLGDAMMPFHRNDLFESAKTGTKGYSWVYTMDSRFRGWTKEHQLIAEWVAQRQLAEDECVHHINFIKTDNRPENLKIMTTSDHNSYHASLNNNVKWSPKNHEWIEEFKKNHSSWMCSNAPTARRDITFGKILELSEQFDFNMSIVAKTLDVSLSLIYSRLLSAGFKDYDAFRAAYKTGDSFSHKLQTIGINDLDLKTIESLICENDSKASLCIKLSCTVNVLNKFLERRANISWLALRAKMGWNLTSQHHGGRPKHSNKGDLTFHDVCNAYVPGLTLPRLAEKLSANKNTILSRLGQHGHKKYSEFAQAYQNCKVASIEYVGVIPLYDLTVDGYKNFATDSVVSHNTPEIAAALDIYSDETAAQDDRGKILHVYSDNEKIKEILEELFYNVLNVEFNMRSWVRNVCKYGDFFLYNDVSPEYGVVNAFPIPVNEIEREENFDRDDPFAVRYRWVTLGNRTLENWEVTHFRLLGNDMFLPYGSSVIEPARRIWRQLILIEDAMLVYRVVRAPERRVFYIDVANIPPENVELYVEKQKAQLRTNQVIDGTSGRVDLRYNPLCFQQHTLIPLLDGRTITIKQLAEEWHTGKRDQETYTLDLARGGIPVPGKIAWVGRSGTTTQLARLTLDDGGIIEVTPDHKMMLRDGNPIKARDLSPGQSLMPMYTKYSTMIGARSDVLVPNSYEMILNPKNGRYYFTHRIVAAKKYGLKLLSNGFITQKRGTVVHHVDFNKLNNSTQNLDMMLCSAHSTLHAEVGKRNIIKYNTSVTKRLKTADDNRKYKKAQRMGEMYNGTELHASHNVNRREGQKRSWSNPKKRIVREAAMRYKWSDECQAYVIRLVRSLDVFEGLEKFLIRLKSDVNFMQIYTLLNSHLARDPSKSLHKFVVGKFIINDYANWKSVWIAHNPNALGRKFVNNVDITVVANEGFNNHKITSVEIVDIEEDVYNVTIDEHHNLTIQSPNCVGTNRGKVQSFQSVDEDYFIPVRGSESGTRIDTLAAGQNVGTVEDVAYIQKKLFAALKIPRAYLGYDEMISCLIATTYIPLLDGTTTTIGELARECQQDPTFDGKYYAYSCDPTTGEFKPGKITKAWKTKEVDRLHRVTLDNGHVIECTENHPFLCRDGIYRRADELVSGQSLMAQHRKFSTSRKFGGTDLIDGYEMLLSNVDGEWRYVHKMVDEQLCKNLIQREGYKNWKDFKETVAYNHKVVSVEVIDLKNPVPVYDLEVEGWHNFLIVDSTSSPIPWASGVQVHNSKATLAQEDIRFSRTISVIQKVIISELNKLAIIHLFANGFTDEDLVNFTLFLSNPSTIAQQQKLEIWRAKFDIASSVPEGYGSKRFVYKKVWGISDEEIEDINNEAMKEKLISAKLEAIEAGSESGGASGGGGGDLFGGGSGDDFGAGGGEEEDIFGDEGGGDATDTEIPDDADEENAGEEPEEDEEPGIDLLISSDDADDDETFKLPSSKNKDDHPVKVSALTKKTQYNHSRRRTHGASKTHMPDFNKMTSNDSESMNDPFDSSWLRSVVSNPLGETTETYEPGRLSPDVASSLAKMQLAFNRKTEGQPFRGMLNEGIDIQEEIDLSNDVLELDLAGMDHLKEEDFIDAEEDIIIDDDDE